MEALDVNQTLIKFEVKYQFLINKRKCTGLNHFNDSKAFIEYSNDMDNIYKNIEEYNPNKKCKIQLFLIIWLLICLLITTINTIVTELFIKGRKLNINLIFVTQSYSSTILKQKKLLKNLLMEGWVKYKI